MNTSDPVVGSFSFSELYQTPHPPGYKEKPSAFKKLDLSSAQLKAKTNQLAPKTIHSTTQKGMKEQHFHSFATSKFTGQVDKEQGPKKPDLIAPGSFHHKPRSVSEPQPYRGRLDLIEESRRAKSAVLQETLEEDGRIFAFDDELDGLKALDALETRVKGKDQTDTEQTENWFG